MEPTVCPWHCPYTPHTHSEDLLKSEKMHSIEINFTLTVVYLYGHTYVIELRGKYWSFSASLWAEQLARSKTLQKKRDQHFPF